MTDKSHFHLSDYVNKQNCRIWASENLEVIHETPLYSILCPAWCGIMSERIIGQYFYENENGQSATINGARYRDMIENFVRPAVESQPDVWYQQDDATAHTSYKILRLLRSIFGDRIIPKNI